MKSKTRIRYYDNVLSEDDFKYYRKKVLTCNFKNVESQGAIYSDISQEVLPVLIYDKMRQIGLDVADKLSFLRAYLDKPGYNPPTWIHSDVLFSDYIGIFMVQSSNFPQDDGVAFWKNKELDSINIEIGESTKKHRELADGQSKDPEKWDLYNRVEFKENRLVIAPASYFHSKAAYGNHGDSIDDCRIVHVMFFDEKKV